MGRTGSLERLQKDSRLANVKGIQCVHSLVANLQINPTGPSNRKMSQKTRTTSSEPSGDPDFEYKSFMRVWGK